MARAAAIQDRTKALMSRAETAAVGLIEALADAKKKGATDEALQGSRTLHRQAQWRLDFVAAENSMGFHAPQESASLLAEAIDLARQGQIGLLSAKATTN